LVTSANVLPWLQDTVEQNVWTRWRVTYRDVRVLDSAKVTDSDAQACPAFRQGVVGSGQDRSLAVVLQRHAGKKG